MKLLWNSLLISLGILLPTSTSIVLAESLKPSESTVAANTSELVQVSDSAVPVANGTLPALGSEARVMPEMKLVSTDTLATKEVPPAFLLETILIPEVTQTPLFGTTADREAFASPPASSSYERLETIVIPDTAPVSTPSAPMAEKTEVIAQTDAPENTETTKAPSSDSEASKSPQPSDSPAGAEPAVDADAPAETTKAPSSDSETSESEPAPDSAEAKEPELSPEELARQQKLIEADKLYTSGQIDRAQQLYREAKAPFDEAEAQVKEQPQAFYDSAQLSPGGSVYWRQSQEGLEQKLETKIMVPLRLLVEQYPEFIPGHLRYAQALKDYDREEEALQVLQKAAFLYPNEPELIKAKITALREAEKWLDASLAARQFALVNSNHPQAEEFKTLADENLERYRSHLRRKLRGNAIANAITGALGFVLTGNLLGPISAIDTTVLMLRGESTVGESIANRAKKQLPMLEDEEVLEYVREVGNKLATVAGRDDFEYEFHVVMDDRLNAFALPGGKVFVNAGAIMKTKSEAELAGLLAHELAHAVLSHGFQLVTQGNFIANVTQYIPFGGTAANLIVLDYNRDMEREADALGARILASSGYAADGLHNLMATLDKEERDRPIFAWLATHPDTEERIRNLETLIERNGYNRYNYEGVERHLEIQKRVAELLRKHKEDEDAEKKD